MFQHEHGNHDNWWRSRSIYMHFTMNLKHTHVIEKSSLPCFTANIMLNIEAVDVKASALSCKCKVLVDSCKHASDIWL